MRTCACSGAVRLGWWLDGMVVVIRDLSLCAAWDVPAGGVSSKQRNAHLAPDSCYLSELPGLVFCRRVPFEAPPGLLASHHAWLCRCVASCCARCQAGCFWAWAQQGGW